MRKTKLYHCLHTIQTMDQRIRDFEPLWNALGHPALVPPPPRLERSTCEHWTLPEAELARWFAAPTEREAILAANRTVHRYSWNEPGEIDAEEARLNKEELKRVEEQKAARDDKTCWLRRAVTELDASSVAILRKEYADMFECKEPQWKINMQKHIDKARELEKQSGKDGKDKGDA